AARERSPTATKRMNAENTEDEWSEFVAYFAQAANVASEDVRREARLVADLGIDSLALAETIVALIERYAPVTLMGDLEGRDWDRVTVGDLYQECAGAIAGPR